MKIKGAIFDMDGTLLDSMHIWRNVATDYLALTGIKTDDQLNSIVQSMTLKQASEYFHDKFALSKSAEDIMDEINSHVEEAYFYKVQAKKGAAQILDMLKSHGIKTAVATLSDQYLAEAAFKRVGIFDKIDCILSCSDIGVGKDKPDIYLKAAETIGTLPFETYVFEDSFSAMKTARSGGFPVVAVYDKWARAPREQIQSEFNLYIDSFLEFDEKYL